MNSIAKRSHNNNQLSINNYHLKGPLWPIISVPSWPSCTSWLKCKTKPFQSHSKPFFQTPNPVFGRISRIFDKFRKTFLCKTKPFFSKIQIENKGLTAVPLVQHQQGWCCGLSRTYFKAVVIIIAVSLLPSIQAEPLDTDPEPRSRVQLPDESGFQVSPSDGKGTVTMAPAAIYAASPVTLTFTYTAGVEGIAVDGGVVCMVSSYWGWSKPQVTTPGRPGYVTVTCSDPEVGLDILADPSSQGIYVRIEKQPLKAGQTITFIYGDTKSANFHASKGHADHYAERGERFYFRVDGDGDGFYVPITEQCFFRVLPNEEFRLIAYSPSRVSLGKPYQSTLSVVDRGNNVVESFEGKVKLNSMGSDVELPQEVIFRPEDRGSIRVEATAVEGGIIIISAEDPGNKLMPAISNPTVVVESEKEPLTLYWADLHGHSNFSDGTGIPEDYFRYARDVARLDVAALTDHDYWGYEPLSKSPKLWHHILDTAKEFNDPGRFVTIYGYEWTNWTYGHMHILFRDEVPSEVIPWNDPLADDPEKLWKVLGKYDCIIIPHHTGGGPIPYYWKYYDPKFMPLVEITSIHGVSERMGHPQSIYSPVESGMVQNALGRGYKLGIIGSGDTHDGHPGMRSISGGVSGLAGIYAKELTQDAIFQALRERRVYATTGCRSILRFHMGTIGMGQTAKLSEAGQPRQFTVSIFADAPIAEITLIKNNEIVATKPGDGLIMTWEWTDTEPARNGDYYYVRIRQTDIQWVYSSPIWIELDQQAAAEAPSLAKKTMEPDKPKYHREKILY